MAGGAPRSASTRKPLARPTRSDLLRGVAGLVAGATGLAVADLVLSGLTVAGIGPLLVASLALGLVGRLLRPVLVAGATVLGWPGAPRSPTRT